MPKSSTSRTILVVSDDHSFQTRTILHLKEIDQDSHSFLSCPLSDAFEYAEIDQPFMVLIDLSGIEELDPNAIKKIVSHFPNSKLVGCGSLKDADSVIQLIKIGIKDFVKLPFDMSEIQGLLNQSDSQPKAHTTKKLGRIVTVLSPKGGTGVTLLTTNLGVSLAQKGSERIGICDLAPQIGDVVTYLDLTASYTLRDLMDNIPRLDHSFLDGVTLSHESGVNVLASPRENQEPLNAGNMTELQAIFLLCRQTYDILLVDAGHTDPALLQLALMHSNLIVLVGNSDVPSLKGLVFTLGKLTKLNYDPNKIKIVINRYDAKNQLDTKEFEKKTKHLIDCRLPNQYALCIEAINNGLPVSKVQKTSNLAKKISELAEMIWDSLVTNKTFPFGSSPADRIGVSTGAPKEKAVGKGFMRWGS